MKPEHNTITITKEDLSEESLKKWLIEFAENMHEYRKDYLRARRERHVEIANQVLTIINLT